MSADDLIRRIERLEAAEGVRDLVARYARVIDGTDLAGEFSSIFTADAVLYSNGEYTGRTAIFEYYESVLSQVTFSRHHILNSAITVEAVDRARHRGAFLAMLGRGGQSIVVFGDYDDLAVRGSDGLWRFAIKGNQTIGSTTLASGWGDASFGGQPARTEG
jgi:SnoaL-like domain